MVSKMQQDLLGVPSNGGRSSKMEQSQLQAAAHQQMLEDEDDDFGEGEVEDTQVTNVEGSLAAAQALQQSSCSPKHHRRQSHQSERKSNRSRSQNRGERTSSRKSARQQQQQNLPPFQSIYSRQLLENFPQRTRWAIPESKIVFSSEFCSGNMSRAARGYQKNYFDIWVACDASPHMDGEYYRTWFYFSVTGVPQGEMLTFNFKNLSNQTKLYNQGLKPSFRVMPSQQKKWRRIMTKVSTFFNSDDQFGLQFSHMFAYPENQTTYFAFTFPFSYQDSLDLTDQIQHKISNAPNCYFNREILYYSLEGRPMELLTISSRDQITDEVETIPADAKGCFPAAEKNPSTRSLRFRKEKPVIFLTSRVHPGETPGSHVLNGFLEMLCDLRSEQGKCLRKNYVFKVIMMLNPDGVSRGYYRLDTMACNLNRMYLNPSKADNPTIWATRKAVVQQAEQYNCLKMFLDFHAHASKRGGFMFGNHIPEQEKQANNITFVKLIAMNCLNFDMNECNFSDKIMAIKDRNGQSREGSSRVALAKATGLTYCYTLEFNYHSGRRINTLAPKYARTTGTIEGETELTDPQSKIYANQSSPPFTKEIFEDCGRAVGSALLDLADDNPISRIPLSCYRTVANVRTDILNNLQKYESGNVNVVGANHFAPTNTKVAKAFANTPGPRIKLNGSAGHGTKAEQEKLKKAASLLTAPKKPAHGTFGVTKRLLDDTNQTNTTASTKANRNADTSVPKEKKNSASVRNPKENGGKSRQTTTCNSASQQPPPSRGGTIARLHHTSSAKQKVATSKKQGQYLQQTQLGAGDTNSFNLQATEQHKADMLTQQQLQQAAAASQHGRLTDQQVQQLQQYHMAIQQQQQQQIQQQQQAIAAAAAQQQQTGMLLNNFGNPIASGSQPAFLMSQQQLIQKDLQSQRLFMQNQIALMQSKMNGGVASAAQQQQQSPTAQQVQQQMSMHQQQMLHQQLLLQKQAMLQQQRHHQQQISVAHCDSPERKQKQTTDHNGVRVNQSLAHPVSKAMAQDSQNGVSVMFDTETNSFQLPNPNGQLQSQYLGGKMRSKSHIRSDLNSGNPATGESNANLNYVHQSGHKKHMQANSSNNHYSPCPKIPSAVESQPHYAAGIGGAASSLVPRTNSDEKGSAGRWSARQYPHHSKQKAVANHDARSVAADQHRQSQYNKAELLQIDSYDRKSYESKGPAIHRSAMHGKNSALLPPKGQNSSYDPQSLHAHKQNMMIANHQQQASENHYLPNISPNYTSAKNDALQKESQHTGLAPLGHMQNSSRTLTSIPQISNKQQNQQQQQNSPKLLQQTGSQQLQTAYPPTGHQAQSLSQQPGTEFINHRSLKPQKKPQFTTVLQNQQHGNTLMPPTSTSQHQHSLIGHKRNQHSKASLQHLNLPKSHETTLIHPALAAADRQQHQNCGGGKGSSNLNASHKPIMNQACLYKSSNTQITSAQAIVPFDPETGVVLNQINLGSNNNANGLQTPKTNAILRSVQANMLEQQMQEHQQLLSAATEQSSQIQQRPKHHTKPPHNTKNRGNHKTSKGQSSNPQNQLQANQSLEGSLKLTTAVSVGSKSTNKKASRLQNKVQSSHSDHEKRIL